MGDWKKIVKRVWHFLWKDNSVWSWIINIVLAFVIIKFLIYPGLGLLLGTNYPIVAVVSGSMDHHLSPGGEICGKQPIGYSTSDFFSVCGDWYIDKGITEQQFNDFPLAKGFRRGET